jgi:hypothetical protein
MPPRIGCEGLASETALPAEPVTLPAAVLDKRRSSLVGRGGECSFGAQEKAQMEASGERRQPNSTN